MRRFSGGRTVHEVLKKLARSFCRQYMQRACVIFGDRSSWLALSSVLPLHELLELPVDIAAIYDWETPVRELAVRELWTSQVGAVIPIIFLIGCEVPSLLEDGLISAIVERVLAVIEPLSIVTERDTDPSVADALQLRVLLFTTWTNAEAAQAWRVRQSAASWSASEMHDSSELSRDVGRGETSRESLGELFPYAALKARIEREVLRRYTATCAACRGSPGEIPCQRHRRDLDVQSWILYAPLLAMYSAFPSQNLGVLSPGSCAWYQCIGFGDDVKPWTHPRILFEQSLTDSLADAALRVSREVAALCAALKCSCTGAFVLGRAPVADAIAKRFVESLECAESEMADLELANYEGLRIDDLQRLESDLSATPVRMCVVFMDRLLDVASAVRHANGMDPAIHDWFGCLLASQRHVLEKVSRRFLYSESDAGSDLDWFIAPLGGVSGTRALLSTGEFTEALLERQHDVAAFLSFVKKQLSFLATPQQTLANKAVHTRPAETVRCSSIAGPPRPPRRKLGATRLGRVSTAGVGVENSQAVPSAMSHPDTEIANASSVEKTASLGDQVEQMRTLIESVWDALEPRQRVRQSGLFIYAATAIWCAATMLQDADTKQHADPSVEAACTDEQRLQSLLQLARNWASAGFSLHHIMDELLDVISNQNLHRVVLPFLAYTCSVLDWKADASEAERTRLSGAIEAAATRAGDAWIRDTANLLVDRLFELSSISAHNGPDYEAVASVWTNWLNSTLVEAVQSGTANATQSMGVLTLPALLFASLEGANTNLSFHPRRKGSALAAIAEIIGFPRESRGAQASNSNVPQLRDHDLILVCVPNGITVSELRAFQALSQYYEASHKQILYLQRGFQFVDRRKLLAVCFGVEGDGRIDELPAAGAVDQPAMRAR